MTKFKSSMTKLGQKNLFLWHKSKRLWQK